MTTCDIAFLKNEVILMEDSTETQQIIKQVMEKLNWIVNIENSVEEVVVYARKKLAAYYILDVHMGNEREIDGIKALKQIKRVNPNVCVTILSGNPAHERLAKNIDVNILFVNKTTNPEQDIFKLASKFLECKQKCLDEKKEETRFEREQLEQYQRSDSITVAKELDNAKNLAAYKIWKTQNFDRYKNKYVAFVNGELVGVADTEEKKKELLKRLMTLPEYCDKSKFFTKVKNNDIEEIIDYPSGYTSYTFE